MRKTFIKNIRKVYVPAAGTFLYFYYEHQLIWYRIFLLFDYPLFQRDIKSEILFNSQLIFIIFRIIRVDLWLLKSNI